jgi:hypothetical protein
MLRQAEAVTGEVGQIRHRFTVQCVASTTLDGDEQDVWFGCAGRQTQRMLGKMKRLRTVPQDAYFAGGPLVTEPFCQVFDGQGLVEWQGVAHGLHG